MTILRLILGDQLNASHPWFRELRDDVVYVMMEVRSETDYVRHHAQKVLALFAAMRRFAEALGKAGHRVHYIRISDPENRQDFSANMAGLISQFGVSTWARQQADEWRVEANLNATQATLGLPCEVVDSAHFLADRATLAESFSPTVPRMEYFYREMRKRHGILVDERRQPLGGRWNFDSENRARWTGDPPAAEWPWVAHDLRELWAELQAAGVATLGHPNAAALTWPLTRREARAGLAHFIAWGLPHFGRYQDAMSSASGTLFHSGLSFALNTKMLHPREVIDAAVAAYHASTAPLASVEGFVRQILGWREYVRGVYWAKMPGYAGLNALAAERPLPEWFWTGNTNMACLRATIGQSLQTAYAHHIQRLMITGNFALLAGCSPDEVDAWYLGIYIDAFEWVEMPNTRGMSQYADGGIVGSKPYAAGANYIQRQSDYCAGCQYQPKQRVGTNACPFNALYWDFLARHQERFQHNPRMGIPLSGWNRLAKDDQATVREQAAYYLARIDQL
ncbi:cryptochrome/photolyase family protein [Chitinimonas naiadis]